jgi:hypothetical protein
VSPRRPQLSAEDILAALNNRGVRYVVIGAFAAIAQGAPIEATYDIDVTPQRDPENLERLSLALRDLYAGTAAADGDHVHVASSSARLDRLQTGSS